MDCWPKLGYDRQNTSHAPDVSTPAREVSESWRFDLTSGLYTSPTIAEGTVYINYESEYFGEEPNVYALDAETGDVRWSDDLGRFGNFWTSPTVSDEALYVVDGSGAHSGNLLALDRTDGSELWRTAGGFTGSATFDDGLVYVGSKAGLVAIDSTDGNVVWCEGKGATTGAIPAIDKDTVFAPHGHGLQAVDAETGDLRWETDTGTDQTSPVVSEQLVFTGGEDGELRAFDVENGSVQWAREVGDQIYESPAVSEGCVFFGSDDGYLHAATTESGEVKWQTALDEWVRQVTYIDESLYVCSWTKGSREESGVYVISPEDGSVRRRIDFDSSPHTPVVAADGRLLVGTVNGLVALAD